jgi:hypothetical protein
VKEVVHMSTSWNTFDASPRCPAEIARLRVLGQHVELRRLLTSGLDHVRAALAGDDWSHVPIRLLVEVTYKELVQHLASEEALVLPILEDDVPLGPLRAERLRQEHAQQREELALLAAWGALDDERELAARFRTLARALLADIDLEERELLTSEVIRDDGIVVDQCGG